ncbi:RNA binding protein, putative [Talaromyces stipitatus ATCC 10500]|uniref:Nucleolar protein 12 n=1 Tax=Talaromyces stipitatus (strain ATCC 10500 / CBS 375.48 / QM 6759 / NRRL 1006) TaxID=441959 RepID=B8MDY6_TALSN|nr:RNA binding protein, putative [Talaromyces stipitatus ATCC 10500]EED16063.1 RNA binding protein, putative [Talaromyces stipitatus ATCC 10500]
MAKKSKSKSDKSEQAKSNGAAASTTLTKDAPIDPLLASLFEKSAGPVKTPSIQYKEFVPKPQSAKPLPEVAELEDGAEDSEDDDSDDTSSSDMDMQDADQNDEDSQFESEKEQPAEVQPSRKRKRGAADNLEDAYMQKLAREEEREKARRKMEKSKEHDVESDASAESDEDFAADSEENSDTPPPVHETVSGAVEAEELDKSNRTVFLGNVSNKAITSKSDKKALLAHISSFLPSLPKSHTPHKIESIRFRSTAYGTQQGVPRRAAYAHKETMDSTTLSTNAYVVFSTSIAAQKAPGALNGTVVLGRHLRVDNIAHPAAIDNKRCVFVGNLDFVGQENDAEGDEENPKKKKNTPPADVEEGLWRTFNANTGVAEKKNAAGGNVESVRVVRDQATRVGKGFAYVQFHDPNCVEAALLLDGKKFPPLLPRKLRVTRARKMSKKRDANPPRRAPTDSAHSTLRGRVKKLLGRAGASKLRNGNDGKPFIFEGQRAVEKTDQFKFKSKSRGGSKGKPKNRSSRRAAAYRASGGRAGRKAAE